MSSTPGPMVPFFSGSDVFVPELSSLSSNCLSAIRSKPLFVIAAERDNARQRYTPRQPNQGNGDALRGASPVKVLLE
jgi:hypothetical protein